MAELNPLWDEYILWLATPDSERGAISTEEAWAKAKGYSNARTTRRWKQNPDFLERQKELAPVSGGADEVTVGAKPKVMAADERDYQIVKSKLIESAKNGNLKAQELYMKQYGKSWLDEETASRVSDFSNMELPALVAQAITAVAPEVLVNALQELGYTVIAPEVKK